MLVEPVIDHAALSALVSAVQVDHALARLASICLRSGSSKRLPNAATPTGSVAELIKALQVRS
jgi:hypothetical protein